MTKLLTYMNSGFERTSSYVELRLYSANPEENIQQVVYMYICAMGHGHSFTSRESVTAGGTSRPEQKADG